MRIIHRRMERVALPGDFEAPVGADAGDCEAFFIRPHPTSSAFAIGSMVGSGRNCVAAVWDAQTGELLWRPEFASDIGWSPDGASAYVLINKFSLPPEERTSNRLRRYRWPECELEQELRFREPFSGADVLAISPGGTWAAALVMAGVEYYYEVLSLQPSLSWPRITYRIDDRVRDGPVFSPDERTIVTVGSPGDAWWGIPGEDQDEDEWRFPSAGGELECGWVHVHDLVTKVITRHALVVDLPAGWQPQPRVDDPNGFIWKYVWGPQFVDSTTFRVWLPDGRQFDLKLPLPERIRVPGLSTVWRSPREGGT
jgi:hypothetical protein